MALSELQRVAVSDAHISSTLSRSRHFALLPNLTDLYEVFLSTCGPGSEEEGSETQFEIVELMDLVSASEALCSNDSTLFCLKLAYRCVCRNIRKRAKNPNPNTVRHERFGESYRLRGDEDLLFAYNHSLQSFTCFKRTSLRKVEAKARVNIKTNGRKKGKKKNK